MKKGKYLVYFFFWCTLLSAQNTALDFDGVNDYVSIPDNVVHEPASVTVEAWVCVDGNTSTKNGNQYIQFIIFKQNSRTSNFEGYTLYYFDQSHCFESTVASSAGTQVHVTSSAVNLGEWNHIAMTANSSTLTFYLNGVSQGSVTTGFALDYGSNPLYFGRTGYNDWEGYFNGKIDEVRIWNYVRTQTDIQNTMNVELNGNEEGLVAYYQMSDGSGTTLTDNSTNNNPGTIYEAAWVDNSDLSLPVELTTFGVEYRSGGVVLNWTTESESENLGFIIQRKISVGANHDLPSDWLQITSYTTNDALAGHGSTSKAHVYTYTDMAVIPGMTYVYRLADVDYSGKVTWHKEAEIQVRENNEILINGYKLGNIYPNPFNAAFTIPLILSEISPVTIKLIDLSGRTIDVIMDDSQTPAGSYNLSVDCSNLGSGIYFLQSEIRGNRTIRKVTLVK